MLWRQLASRSISRTCTGFTGDQLVRRLSVSNTILQDTGKQAAGSVKQDLSNAVDPPDSRDTGASTTSSSEPTKPTLTTPERDSTTDDARIVVFGGNGYVGSRVCKAALAAGLQVVSVSRSGKPASGSGNAAWVQDVEWAKGDALAPEQWRSVLNGALGVVSCIGAFGNNDFMLKVNGTANVTIVNEAVAAGVARMSYISAHDYNFPGAWHVPDYLMRGYFHGKRMAEQALFEAFPEGGVALRPGFIYGTRHVGSFPLPLGIIGAPLEAVLKLVPSRSLAGIPVLGLGFVPPVSVDAVGKAAVAAATDVAVPAGVMDVWTIQKYS